MTSADHWTEVFPSLAPDADCASRSLALSASTTRVPLYAFKDYLHHLNGARGWLTDVHHAGHAHVAERNRGRTPGLRPAPRKVPTGTNLTSGCANGNGPLVQKLLHGRRWHRLQRHRDPRVPTATRSRSPPTAGSRDDDVFWTQAPNPSEHLQGGDRRSERVLQDDRLGPRGSDCDPGHVQWPACLDDGRLVERLRRRLAGRIPWSARSRTACCSTTTGPPYSLEGCGTACEGRRPAPSRTTGPARLSDGGQATLPGQRLRHPSALNISGYGAHGCAVGLLGQAGRRLSGDRDGLRAARRERRRSTSGCTLAYNQCTGPSPAGMTHGPPLAVPSCNPPVKSSSYLTIGSARHAGNGKARAVPRDRHASRRIPATPARRLTRPTSRSQWTSGTSARTISPTTPVSSESTRVLRITDRFNGVTQTRPATTMEYAVADQRHLRGHAGVRRTSVRTCALTTTGRRAERGNGPREQAVGVGARTAQGVRRRSWTATPRPPATTRCSRPEGDVSFPDVGGRKQRRKQEAQAQLT